MIKLVIFDFDGVFTDGNIIFDNEGNAIKHYNAKDGMGIFRLHDTGIEIGVISGWKNNNSQLSILEHLKIKRVSLGSNNKLEILNKWCEELSICLNEVAYMGDDLNDIDVMTHVGLVGCPNDAVLKVKNIANFISSKNGGNGAIRDFTDYLINSLDYNISSQDIILKDIINSFNYQISKYKNIDLSNIINSIKCCNGNIYFLGVGKSGNMAKHCSDLLKSISIKAIYIDIINLLHGDLGLMTDNDIIIIFSNSGNTTEIYNIIKIIKKKIGSIIGIFNKNNNSLNTYCDIVYTLPYIKEIDGDINNIPTNSCMTQLLFSNILVSLLKKKFDINEYKNNHLAGNIGNKLKQVSDILCNDYACLKINNDSDNKLKLTDIFIEMIKYKTSTIFFIDENGMLKGLLTDGDIRRQLVLDTKKEYLTINDINTNYYSVTDLNIFVNDLQKYNHIPVVDIDNKILGIINNI